MNTAEWDLMAARGAGVIGKKFGISVFNLLPSERIAWPPAAFFSAVWFKKITVF